MAEQALTFDQVENLWVQAGGNPQAAAMAAAIADASSGLNPDAQGSTTSDDSDASVTTKGLWQIPSTLGALSTTDPLANARAAVQLSANGTDFSQWPVAWSNNDGTGTLLGQGSNAVAALQAQGGTYQVIGASASVSAPTSQDATGAATTAGDPSATPATATAAPSSGSHRTLYIALALIIIAAAVYYTRMKPKGVALPDTGVADG